MTMHEFEQKGLGKAPFHLKELVIHDGLDARCDFCRQALKREFIVQSDDGRSFSVGSDCVKKTADYQLIQAVEDESNRVRLEQMACLLKDERVLQGLASKPHPTDFYARQGQTLRDYIDYTLKNGKTTGRLKVAAIVESTVAELKAGGDD